MTNGAPSLLVMAASLTQLFGARHARGAIATDS